MTPSTLVRLVQQCLLYHSILARLSTLVRLVWQSFLYHSILVTLSLLVRLVQQCLLYQSISGDTKYVSTPSTAVFVVS